MDDGTAVQRWRLHLHDGANAPRQDEPGELAESGRGLLIAAGYAIVEHVRGPDGHVVRARVPMEPTRQ